MQEFSVDYSAVIWHLKQIGKVKRLNKWVTHESESRSVMSNSLWPHRLYSPWNSPGQNTGVSSHSLLQGISPPRGWTLVSHIAGGFFTSWAAREASWAYHKSRNIAVLKCHLLLFYTTTMNSFLIRLWCVMKTGFYITTRNDQLSGWTEMLQSTSQGQTCTQKKGHGHCLVVCSYSDPLQLSEARRNHYIWEACSTNQWDTLKTATSATPVLVHGKVAFLQDKTWSQVTQCAVLR